jgi:hypothetical protein
MPSGFKKNDPAHKDFQYLEDLSTAYWYSTVLFTAIELELFFHMEKGLCSSQAPARSAPGARKTANAGFPTWQGPPWKGPALMSMPRPARPAGPWSRSGTKAFMSNISVYFLWSDTDETFIGTGPLSQAGKP